MLHAVEAVAASSAYTTQIVDSLQELLISGINDAKSHVAVLLATWRVVTMTILYQNGHANDVVFDESSEHLNTTHV